MWTFANEHDGIFMLLGLVTLLVVRSIFVNVAWAISRHKACHCATCCGAADDLNDTDLHDG